MFSRFDDIGRMDERAKFRTPGHDRVRDGRQLLLQEDGGADIDTAIAHVRAQLRDAWREFWDLMTDSMIETEEAAIFGQPQRAGDEVI